MNLEMFVRFAIKRKLKNPGENFGEDKIDKFQYVEQFKTWAAAWVFFFVVGSFDSLTFEKG